MMQLHWKSNVILFLAGMLIFTGCLKEQEVAELSQDYRLDIPEGFPYPNIPADNLPTKARIELGKRLFFDERLSLDNSISCASCHIPDRAFADTKPLSHGFRDRQGLRNSPSLANVAYQDEFMMDGGVPNLELQSLAPIHDDNEMNFDISAAVVRLNKDKQLREMSQNSYDRDSLDSWVITRALANFQRTLLSGNSRYDQFAFQGNRQSLTARELRGMYLFFSERTQCSSCHSGLNFSDGGYHNIGLYENYEDSGRERISNIADDRGKFKTPSLRNVALTAPYMHNGSISTLEMVIDHFANGGSSHFNKDERIKKLDLSDSEKSDLVAFLNALTDEKFINNPDFRQE